MHTRDFKEIILNCSLKCLLVINTNEKGRYLIFRCSNLNSC